MRVEQKGQAAATSLLPLQPFGSEWDFRREILPKKMSQRGFGGALLSGFAASMRVGTYNGVQLSWLDRRDAQKPSADATRWSEPTSKTCHPRGSRSWTSRNVRLAKDPFITSRFHSPMRLPSEMGDRVFYVVALNGCVGEYNKTSQYDVASVLNQRAAAL
jgi:hypothetical protein